MDGSVIRRRRREEEEKKKNQTADADADAGADAAEKETFTFPSDVTLRRCMRICLWEDRVIIASGAGSWVRFPSCSCRIGDGFGAF